MGRKENIFELLSALGLKVGGKVMWQLENYIELWLKWNKKVKLTAEMTEEKFLKTQLANSLLLWRLFDEAGNYLDIGSGAGLPAIPLSLLLRNETVLVESNYKKASFLNVCKRELGIPWIRVYNGRIEEMRKSEQLVAFKYITARAVAPIKDVLRWASDFIGDDTVLLLPKGDKADTELEDARKIMDSLGLTYRIEKLPHPFSAHPYQVVVLTRAH